MNSFKPNFDEEAFYQIDIPLSGRAVPEKIRLEVWKYGGQGFRFLELLAGRKRYVPAAVVQTTGLVRDPGHILLDDNRWTWLGDPDAYKAFHDRAVATAVHSITMTLLPML
jgi:hypothetical protein